MAVVLEVVFPGLSPAQYDQLKEKVGWVTSPPVGGVSHIVWWEGDDCHGIDVWESEEAWGALVKNGWGQLRLNSEYRWKRSPPSTSHMKS